jgi:hypothetical protein
MWFKHRAWIPVAWLLSLGNLAAAWVAARTGGSWHAAIHVVLATGLAAGARVLMIRQRHAPSDDLRQALDDNERLQQVVESMQPRMQELEERVDFAERLIATQREAERRDAPPR